MAQANSKAQTVVAQAEVFNQGTQEKVNEALSHFLSQELVVYQQLFENVRQETLKALGGMSGDIKKQAEDQLSSVSRQFALAMTDAQKRAQAQLEQAYLQAHEDITAYKATRIKQLNQLTSQFVQEATRRYLKKSLSREQHEQLVMEALDEAKRENLF